MTNYNKFKVGILEILLLKLLSEKDLYGYEMIKLVKSLSNNIITITVSGMYPMLHKLKEQGLITSYELRIGERKNRIYYHLTDKGYAELCQMRDDFERLIAATYKILNYTFDIDTK